MIVVFLAIVFIAVIAFVREWIIHIARMKELQEIKKDKSYLE